MEEEVFKMFRHSYIYMYAYIICIKGKERDITIFIVSKTRRNNFKSLSE